ncbi:isopentenyl transferase family protein [Glacieibacterium megasporae]|uniref:isopentenyl transferase family protein n=1 Tax=Glacieibacterium megasporae TaxID=2835787 RepID=UPI001C1E7EA5|nr:isopentenyl transferase family protein [Polymorphobacter megasporae]UAJ12419.1 AAA family ATPase [Polymorphobacter megasporae]
MSLAELGCRICIFGPSSSGKSTLATAIGRSHGLPVVHLDQLHHQPGTDWQPRPLEEFSALHDKAIDGASWVMEGNYSQYVPRRLNRATGVILLDVSGTTSLLRYLRRSWFERDRHGALEGGRDSVKWLMIRHILVATPPSRKRYAAMFEQISLPKVKLASARDVRDFYRSDKLQRSKP